MAKGLFRNGPHKRWRCRVRYPDGSVRCLSTGQRDYAAALITYRRLQREAADPLFAPRKPARLEDVLRDFVDHHGGADGTVEMYTQKSAALVAYLGADRDVNQLGLVDLEDYARRRRIDAISDHTISKEMITLRAALKRGRRTGRVVVDPAVVIPQVIPHYVPRERYLERGEFASLMAILKPRRRAIVGFLVFSGARDSEWQRLERRHVDLERRRCTLPGTKTKNAHRVIPLAGDVVELLAGELAIVGPEASAKIFKPWSNIRRDLGVFCLAAGIPPVTPNDLRRTFATWCWQGGMPVDRIARLLGHKDSRMVERVYGKLRAEDLAGDIERILGAVRLRDGGAAAPALSVVRGGAA